MTLCFPCLKERGIQVDMDEKDGTRTCPKCGLKEDIILPKSIAEFNYVWKRSSIGDLENDL